jgi:AcrR family transcriptional regulator
MRNPADPALALRAPGGRGRELIDAAAAMFRERGYDGTSMSELAEAVGLLKASLYHYVRSKEDLLYEVVRVTHDDNRALLDRSTYRSADALGCIEEFVRRNLTYILAHPANAVAFDQEARGLTAGHREELVIARRAYRRFVTRLVEEAQLAGDVSFDVDAKLAAVSLLSWLNSVARWWRPDGGWSAEQLADVQARLIVNGLRSRA